MAADTLIGVVITLFRPIQKRLLIHEVEYSKYSKDNWAGESYEEPININNVRIEPKTSLLKSGDGEEVQSSSLLFIDKTQSIPLLKLEEKDKVVFQNKEMTVQKVNVFYNTKDIHHWELILV